MRYRWNIIDSIKYKITGDKRYCNNMGVDIGLTPEEVFSKLDKAITIFDDEIDEY